MSAFENIFKDRKTLILIIVFLIIFLVLFILVPLLFKAQNQNIPVIQITPTPGLTQKELQYPEATPQLFFNNQATQTGTLVVYSNLANIKVMIDDPDKEVPSNGSPIPINITPFKISKIPIGDHTLFVAKQGYIPTELKFEIQPDQITRLSINLTPLGDKVGY